MTNKIKCCRNCTERHVGCHGECEKYIAERKKADEEMAARELIRQGMYGAIDSRQNNQVYRRKLRKRGG